MWSAWPRSRPSVELVLGAQRWWQFSSTSACLAEGQAGAEEAITSISQLPAGAQVQIWLTGALLPAAVFEPPSELVEQEWKAWLRYMAVQAFGAEADADGRWVLWCSAAQPAKCRVLGMRKALWDQIHAACVKKSLRRMAPLWALLEESSGPDRPAQTSMNAFDGDCIHAMRIAPDGQCLDHATRFADWQSCERLHRRQLLSNAGTPSALWRWQARSGLTVPALGWEKVLDL